MEKANLKICSFYVSDWHLTAMLLPYIEDAIERSERLNTIFEKNISYNMKEILTRIKISDRKKDEIMKVGWENKEIVKYNEIKKYMEKVTKEGDKITLIVEGRKERIECIGKNIEKWMKKSEKKIRKKDIRIINCYEVTEFNNNLQEILDAEQYYIKESMSKHTTFRVGGPAEYYVRHSRKQIKSVLKLCKQFEIPWMIIGNGSNLLVGDKGIQGVVIELGKMADTITVKENCVIAEAGALLSVVAKYAASHRLTGMEFASGIPGSIGGAVVMNAGAYDGEIKQILKRVTVLTEEGEEKELSLEELDFGALKRNYS